MELENLIARYPKIYHMAEKDTWPSIRDRGLLSTTAALNTLGVLGTAREKFESSHRIEKMDVIAGSPENIVLRDQKPMPTNRLLRALKGGITPTEWYKLINEKVFFWARQERLHKLLNAREYRNLEHDVLTIDSASLMRDYRDKIWLCHMNSGNTWPMPHARDVNVFQRISDYPTRKNGNPIKEVVEITVDLEVPNIKDYVIEVWRMQGSNKKIQIK